FWAMPYGERYIWGATASILRGLCARLYGDETDPTTAAGEDAA
ncbi:MAG: CoA pyrophosphatase, partial [Brevundimonas sp.]